MNELIKVTVNDQQEQRVSARELHEKLGLKQDFTSWFKYQAEKLGLKEDLDFTTILVESTGGRPAVDFNIAIDTAKHLSMISGGEKAHEIRKYFIKVEKAWNDPEMVMARSLQFAQQKLLGYEEKVKLLEIKVEQDKPKVIFADAVSVSKTSILIGELAKLLKQNGLNVGQNRLFEKLRQEGFLIRRKGSDYNMPTQKAMDLELFEIREATITHSDGHTTTSKTAKVTGKGQLYFINKFLA